MAASGQSQNTHNEKKEENTARLRLSAESRPIILDSRILDIIKRNLPCERQYDDLAIYLLSRNGKKKNWLRTRRQGERAQFRPKKNRFEKIEKLDDLYFCLCDLCHDQFPTLRKWRNFLKYFRPYNVPLYSQDLILELAEVKRKNADDKNSAFLLDVKRGRKGKVLFKNGDKPALPLDLPLLYALLRRKAYSGKGDYLISPKMLEAIVALNAEDLTAEIILNHDLPGQIQDKIWDTGNIRLMRMLLERQDFVLHLDDRQAEEILELNDFAMLGGLSSNLPENYEKFQSSTDLRLGREKFNMLKEQILAFRESRQNQFL